jgi:hypothetical protein
MALTLTNQETFLVLHWLESDGARISHIRDHAKRLAHQDRAIALPRLSDIIYDAVENELPALDGMAATLLQAGLNRVNFYELALALLLETGVPVEARAA